MVASVGYKFDRLSPMMNERLKRRWAACEAMAIGRGGISLVSQATGISRTTIRKGVEEVEQEYPELARSLGEQRIRARGGGRRPLVETDDTLVSDLNRLIEPATRGEPTSPLLWTSKSTRHLADELGRMGHQVSYRTVGRILEHIGYSLQANRKTEEGKQHPDRDAQFEYINKLVRRFQRRMQPVISVDAKQRELLGNLKQKGREWNPVGHPQRVRVHDFKDVLIDAEQRIRNSGSQSRMASMIWRVTRAGSVSALTTTRPNSQSRLSGVGGAGWDRRSIRTPPRCW